MTTGLLVVAFVWGPSILILAGLVVVECLAGDHREPVPALLDDELLAVSA